MAKQRKEPQNVKAGFQERTLTRAKTTVICKGHCSRQGIAGGLSGQGNLPAPARLRKLERAGVELVIGALFREQLLVGAALDDAAVVEHHDDV